jgi:DNA excision repair protein ERCC-3
MFGNGRARSGVIVLPCGAGKTLVGISAATTIAASTIILCPNQTSVGQWAEQLTRYTDVASRAICILTAKRKEVLPPASEACILLTTYTMIGSGGRSPESAAIMRAISSREWGCMLLDEVHQAVANTFSKALRLRAHCRLGLTATLVREDGRDRRLALFIGPKLYEANWMDLTRAGCVRARSRAAAAAAAA